MCVYDGCNNWAGFNFEGLKAKYCSIHKEDGMENVKDRKCVYEGCRKCPSFNYDNEKKTLYCGTHKKDGMVNIFVKSCIYENCKKVPSFNTKNEKKAIYCGEHKEDGMVDIKHSSCVYEDCKTQAVFNMKGNKKGLYCQIHKADGMIDIKNKVCVYKDCIKRPTFNYEGQKHAIYCLVHKLKDMYDILNKICKSDLCKKQPAYNYKGEITAFYCSEHKEKGMINIRSSTCKNKDCMTLPNYNYEGKQKGLYCLAHKLDTMIDVKNKKICKTHLCPTRVTDKYDGYCLRCYIYTFPDKPVTRNYKTKERAVVDFVCERFPEHTWITDKKVNDGCSMRRPDILLDLGYQVLIIEIDENAHQDYDCSCENKRIMELSQDVGHRPIIFIRFNPDSYRKGNIKIPSCWEQNMNGICVVKYKEDWEYRLHTLEAQIKYWTSINNSTNKIIETIQLFYDI
jgi:hypothetical protein